MKSLRICAILAALVLVPAIANGQGSIGLSGTYVDPVKHLNTLADPGAGGGVEVFVSVVEEYLGIGGRVAYNQFDVNSDTFTSGKTKVLELVPSLRLNLVPNYYKMNLFIQAGYGWYKWSVNNKINDETINKFDHTDNGGYVGVGIQGRISDRVSVVVEPQYHMINSSHRSQLDKKDLQYWSFNLGIQFE